MRAYLHNIILNENCLLYKMLKNVSAKISQVHGSETCMCNSYPMCVNKHAVILDTIILACFACRDADILQLICLFLALSFLHPSKF